MWKKKKRIFPFNFTFRWKMTTTWCLEMFLSEVQIYKSETRPFSLFFSILGFSLFVYSVENFFLVHEAFYLTIILETRWNKKDVFAWKIKRCTITIRKLLTWLEIRCSLHILCKNTKIERKKSGKTVYINLWLQMVICRHLTRH